MKPRRLHIIVTATLFGILIWVWANMREQYQVTLNVPLVLDNVPEGRAVRTPLPQTLQVKLRGDGWQLAAMTLGQQTQVVIPYRSLRQNRRMITMQDVAERLSMRPGVQLVEVFPDSIPIELDRWGEKKVPVRPELSLSFKEGYGKVGRTLVSPDSVTVGGAASLVNSLTFWETVHAVFEDLTAPLEANVPLARNPTYQFSLSLSTVHVRVSVEPFAEKAFEGLAVDIRGVPPNREVILIPPRVEVVARAGIKQLATLSTADFQVAINYPSIMADTTGVIKASITAPEGVHIVSTKPENLQYVVRRRL